MTKVISYLFGVLVIVGACNKNSTPDLGTITDIDGNIYHIVRIGNQYWMKENLKTSHYRNGDPIPMITDSIEWGGLWSTGAWNWYNHDSATYAIYGKLYNWSAVNDPRGLSPQGWHVPGIAEWMTLSTSLGGDSIAGGALKEKGLTHWMNPNTGATNSSGFTALPGGVREMNGEFRYIGMLGNWWTSTGLTPGEAWYCTMFSYIDLLFMAHSNLYKTNGLSVRCVRD